MQITRLEPYPRESFSYLNAVPSSRRLVAGMQGVERSFLPITVGYVSGLPAALQGLVVVSDLQGRVKDTQTRELQLLGEVLPETLRLLIEIELGLDPLQFGAVLAGDMYAVLDKRGGLGDVIPVWEAFRAEFKWVAGVAGNHDSFGEPPGDKQHFQTRDRMFLLDGGSASPDGFHIGGVSGIIGAEGKPNRLSARDFLRQVDQVLSRRPDLMVLHQGPDVPEALAPGNELIRELLEIADPTLVICGHCHWNEPLHTFPNGVQVLNSDARAFILVPEDQD